MSSFRPFTEEKVWGSVQHIFSNPYAAVSCLTVKKGYRCSIHYHEDRVNIFNVLEGKIIVECFGLALGDRRDPQPSPSTRVTLLPGDTFDVGPYYWHRFRVLESGRVVEVYYVPDRRYDGSTVRLDDITRWDEGGIDE